MGESFGPATPQKSKAIFDKHFAIYDSINDYYYRPHWKGDSLFIDELLLKIKQTIDNEQMSNIYTNKFIQKYNSDKLLFPYNTPDLLYVGLIIKNNNYDK